MDCTKGPWACVAMLVLLTACPGGGGSEGDAGSSTGPDDLTSGPMATTIPLPPIDSSGSSDGADTSAGSTDDGTATEATSTGSTSLDGSSSDGGPSSSGEPGESSSDDGGPTSYSVDWCILQYPPSVTTTVGVPFTVYVRLYAPGLTEQTGATDPAPELVVEVGYSVDGSDPSTGMGAPWTWETATPNVGYGPGAFDYSANNDEYQHDLAIPMVGVFDYAARISGDSGTTWVYCDLDGLVINGYTPDQAGSATIEQ